MMSGRSKKVFAAAGAIAAVTIAIVQTVSAAERVNLDRVIACANESDDARRLACYDREMASVKAPTGKTPSASTPAVVTRSAAAKPAAAAAAVAIEDDFGVQGSEIARQRRSEQQQEQEKGKAEADSVSAKVTEVSTRPRGELVVTLDNGQAWAQKKVEPYFPIKAGDQVTINAGMLGSFRLVNGNRSTQVTRVR